MKNTIVVALVLAATGLNAQTFYHNGLPNQQNGNEMTNWMQTEDFILPQPELWCDLHFWTIEAPGAFFDGTVEVYLYDDNGGQPGNVLAVQLGVLGTNMTKTFTQGGILGFYDEYEYSIDWSPNCLQLMPGVLYHSGCTPILRTAIRLGTRSTGRRPT